MMEPPLPRTDVPSGGTGSGRGGGSVWLPSADIHVLQSANGELRPTQLVYIGTEEKICFGMIGLRQFCHSKVCKTKAHKSTKSSMGCKGGLVHCRKE
jgi:hypothetical protein